MTLVRRAVLLLAGLVAAGAAAVPMSAVAAQAPTSVTVTTPSGDVRLIADRLEEIGADDLVIATGNVEVTRGTQRLTADRVELNRATGDVVAEGRAVFYDGDDRLFGERIEYNYRTGTGVVHDGAARAAPYYRIAGERMERLGEGRYHVRRGVFTTCEDDPPTWSFRFGSADADMESYLYGTEASFWVKRFPLIPFVPFFAAAIRRERQTGFLFPRFGSSSRKGTYLELPFFWAISDSQDALITLDAYGDIGLGANLEYRYLLSRTHYGSVNGFYVNEFERSDDLQDGVDDNRGWWSIEHRWRIGPRFDLTVDVNGVSDDRLFRDYGDPLATRASQRVESNIFLTRSWPTANLAGNLFFYRDLTTPEAVELHRLPDIRYAAPRQPLPWLPAASRLLGELNAQYVNFVRDVGSEGQRLDVQPILSRPFSLGGYVTLTPFVGGRFTAYDKTVTGTRAVSSGAVTVETTDDEPRLRRLVQLGGDVEARASRVYEVGGFGGIDAVLHSIEPRVNYTFIEGSDLLRQTGPDTFRPNRLPQWDAVDAISETSLITYSLTNRVRGRTVAPAGTEPLRWEAVRVALGQTYNLHDDDRPFGDVLGILIVNPGQILGFRSDASYNVYGNGLTTATADVTVEVPRFQAAVGARVARDREVDLSGRVQTTTRQSFLQTTMRAELFPWAVVRLESNWDVKQNVFVENRYGVDLRWQCWAFTLEYVRRHNDEDEVRFALNLLGVGQPLQFGSRLQTSGGLNTSGDGRIR
ncbi:MAG TPA: LPS assembly protein LptD [Methylomirabilota bacterium]|nr:LPS assembly protein LptD [Methylomirabilota bacterium]